MLLPQLRPVPCRAVAALDVAGGALLHTAAGIKVAGRAWMDMGWVWRALCGLGGRLAGRVVERCIGAEERRCRDAEVQ